MYIIELSGIAGVAVASFTKKAILLRKNILLVQLDTLLPVANGNACVKESLAAAAFDTSFIVPGM